MNSLLNASASALGAFSVGMQVTANNIANMNTPDFQARKIHYATGPEDYGVRVGMIGQDTSPGAPLLHYYQDTVDISATAQAHRNSSNVSLEKELVSMISTEHAFKANAAVVSTYDEISGTVLDMKV